MLWLGIEFGKVSAVDDRRCWWQAVGSDPSDHADISVLRDVRSPSVEQDNFFITALVYDPQTARLAFG